MKKIIFALMILASITVYSQPLIYEQTYTLYADVVTPETFVNNGIYKDIVLTVQYTESSPIATFDSVIVLIEAGETNSQASLKSLRDNSTIVTKFTDFNGMVTGIDAVLSYQLIDPVIKKLTFMLYGTTGSLLILHLKARR